MTYAGAGGQTGLSVLWAATGFATLVAGLTRDVAPLRHAALTLLAITAGKVFVYDLASLDSIARVGSLVGLGLLLLAGAFAWQRVRPRATPDLREAGADAALPTPTLRKVPPEPRHPTSLDEELLEAESSAILSELTDAQRILRIQDELRAGFAAALPHRQGGVDLRLRPHAARRPPLRRRASARAAAR